MLKTWFLSEINIIGIVYLLLRHLGEAVVFGAPK